MKRHFVRTKNFDALELGVESLAECGAREARWMLNTARPGEGKTTNLNHLASRMGAVFITAQQGWRPTQMIAALAHEMGIVPGRDPNEAIGEALAGHSAEGRIVIVDEAQFALQGGAACLERLRGITDKSATPVILVAMADDVEKFGKREQISSRIFSWVRFEPTDKEDVGRACQELAEVQIGPDLIARIHADSAGRMRDVVKAISRIEMVAKALGKDSVSAADLRHTTLVENYLSGIVGKTATKRHSGGARHATRGSAV